MKSLCMITLLITAIASAEDGGLKKVNYADETSDAHMTPGKPEEGALTPEQSKQLMLDVEKIKKNKAEAEEYLKELDEEQP